METYGASVCARLLSLALASLLTPWSLARSFGCTLCFPLWRSLWLCRGHTTTTNTLASPDMRLSTSGMCKAISGHTHIEFASQGLRTSHEIVQRKVRFGTEDVRVKGLLLQPQV